MANEKKKTQEASNPAELKRLKDEIAKQEKVNARLNAELTTKTNENAKLAAENGRLNLSLTGAYSRIKNLEGAVNKEAQGEDGVKDGYVTIASCPLPNGDKPIRLQVDGIIVPRNIDEDGVCYEDIPVATAIAVLSEGSGFKRYLVGPVNSIKGMIRKGLYTVEAVYHRHSKKRDSSGKYEFVRTLVEEFKPKA